MADPTPVTAPGTTNYTGTALTWTAVTTSTPDDVFTMSGRDLLLFRNDNTGTNTVTITSVADPYGRTKDGTIAMAAGGYAMFGPLATEGWADSSTQVGFSAAAGSMFATVITIPPGITN